MILFRDYDEKEMIDRVWYKSSDIIYSECKDMLGQLKTVKVVFKGGRSYIYKDVDVNDYVMFVHGGLDGSNGKAFNQFMKKYNFEKGEKIPVEELSLDMERRMKAKKAAEKEKEGTI